MVSHPTQMMELTFSLHFQQINLRSKEETVQRDGFLFFLSQTTLEGKRFSARTRTGSQWIVEYEPCFHHRSLKVNFRTIHK